MWFIFILLNQELFSTHKLCILDPKILAINDRIKIYERNAHSIVQRNCLAARATFPRGLSDSVQDIKRITFPTHYTDAFSHPMRRALLHNVTQVVLPLSLSRRQVENEVGNSLDSKHYSGSLDRDAGHRTRRIIWAEREPIVPGLRKINWSQALAKVLTLPPTLADAIFYYLYRPLVIYTLCF